jgi:ribose transport system ATP-binding protein
MVALPHLTSWGKIRKKAEVELGNLYQSKLKIKAFNLSLPVKSLSGGNQQKVVLGKWLAVSPNLLLLDEPTAGIDVGSKREIYEIIRGIVRSGSSVLLVSSELNEIIELSDRVVILREGHHVGILSGDQITPESVFALATRSLSEAV